MSERDSICAESEKPQRLIGRPPTPLSERFWPKVAKAGADECWLWIGTRNLRGYGRIERRTATHASWFLHFGEWPPPGMFVCHKCDNPPCVNPSHLFIGTCKDNMQDAASKGRCSTHTRKLTEAEVIALIDEWLSSDETAAAFARKKGISKSNFYDILTGETWSRSTGLPKCKNIPSKAQIRK